MSRRAFVGAALAGGANRLWPLQQRAVTLRAVAATRGIFYGSCATLANLRGDAGFAAAVARECALIVPEGELKWTSVQPVAGLFSFTRGDQFVSWARERGIGVRGHTLVWHQALPGWVSDAATGTAMAASLLERHIGTVVGHYAGQMHSWDVCNEVINLSRLGSNGLRRSLWFQRIGPEYIDLAFRVARGADPAAKLVLSEGELDYPDARQAARRSALLDLLEGLVRRNVPIDAFGMHSHLHAERDDFDGDIVHRFIEQVAQLGLKVYITELDVLDNEVPGDVARRDAVVAAAYHDYLEAVLASPAVTVVETWGLSDRYTWLAARPRSDGLPVRPLPLDAALQPKAAYRSLVEGFDRARPR